MSFINADEFRKRRQVPYESLIAQVREKVANLMEKAEEGAVEVTNLQHKSSDMHTLKSLPAWKDLNAELKQLGFTLCKPTIVIDGEDGFGCPRYAFCSYFRLSLPDDA